MLFAIICVMLLAGPVLVAAVIAQAWPLLLAVAGLTIVLKLAADAAERRAVVAGITKPVLPPTPQLRA